MSILFAEYNEETAKRVYAEELMENVAQNMLEDDIPIEKIAKYTQLPISTIEQLRQQMPPVLP